jgi:2-dehydropantoate 2-reductase
VKMRHAILGVGGVGGLIGALLARAGDDVTIVLRPETSAKYPACLSLESPFGSFTVPVRRVTAVKEPFDILWIAVKATHLGAALAAVEDVSHVLAIVPLLNGIDHIERLRVRFGAERVVPATLSVESERVAPGRIAHRSPFAHLNVAALGESRLSPAMDKLRQAGFAAQFVADESTLMWSKLVFLAPLALTTSAARMAIGDVRSDPAWETRLERCASEACAVGAASGAHLDLDGIVESLRSLPVGLRSSMQKDVEAGNVPELDAIAGPIVTGGMQFGIDVSVTRNLVDTVRAQMSR